MRLFISFFTCLFISTGAISKGIKSSELFNHLSAKHTDHADHSNHHSHNPDNKQHDDHAHAFELSLLTNIFSAPSSSSMELAIPEAFVVLEGIGGEPNLSLHSYHFTIFRPPIA